MDTLESGCGKPLRIAENRFGQADFTRPFGHQPGKVVLGARHSLGDDDAAVIGRLDNDALDKIFKPDRGFELGEHGRCPRHRPAGPPGILRNLERVIECQPAAADGVEHHLHRHQLGQRCRRNQVVSFLANSTVPVSASIM
jgi:hypothetical protein